jgi:hypothetical protein
VSNESHGLGIGSRGLLSKNRHITHRLCERGFERYRPDNNTAIRDDARWFDPKVNPQAG